jgi:hypothetical protein
MERARKKREVADRSGAMSAHTSRQASSIRISAARAGSGRIAAVDVLLGVFGQVVSWPMGLILYAKGASRWLFQVETPFVAVPVARSLSGWWIDTDLCGRRPGV